VQRLEEKALRRLRWYARRTFTTRPVQEGAYGPRSKHGQKAPRKPEPEKHLARLKVAGSVATPVSIHARPNPSARKRPKLRRPEAGYHPKGGSRRWTASSPVEDRGFTQAQWLIKASSSTSLSLFAGLCLAAWSYTLGASGKTLFNEIFGYSDGPWVRFIVWLFAFSFGPISAMLAAFSFADWFDDRSRLSPERGHAR
jgi:hypothetical protein